MGRRGGGEGGGGGRGGNWHSLGGVLDVKGDAVAGELVLGGHPLPAPRLLVQHRDLLRRLPLHLHTRRKRKFDGRHPPEVATSVGTKVNELCNVEQVPALLEKELFGDGDPVLGYGSDLKGDRAKGLEREIAPHMSARHPRTLSPTSSPSERERERERERDRERDRERQRETERDRDRDRQTDRQTDRQRK